MVSGPWGLAGVGCRVRSPPANGRTRAAAAGARASTGEVGWAPAAGERGGGPRQGVAGGRNSGHGAGPGRRGRGHGERGPGRDERGTGARQEVCGRGVQGRGRGERGERATGGAGARVSRGATAACSGVDGVTQSRDRGAPVRGRGQARRWQMVACASRGGVGRGTVVSRGGGGKVLTGRAA